MNGKYEKRRRLFWAGMLVVGCLFVIVYLVLTGNSPQMFTDIVNEYTAIHASNKSAERNLFYILSAAGALACFVFYFKTYEDRLAEPGEREKMPGTLLVLALAAFSAMHYFIYSGVNWLLAASMILVLLLFLYDRKDAVSGMVFLFVCSYAVCGIYRIYVLLGGDKAVSMMTVSLAALAVSVMLMLKGREKEGIYIRGTLAAQLAVPFLLLVYLASRYKSGEMLMEFSVPPRVLVTVTVLVLVFFAEAVYKVKKKWNDADCRIGEAITYGTCICVMAYNRFDGSGAILSTDLHHPFENIIGYSQMVELGQKAFEEYIPVSGLYSVAQGFFLSFFGGGKAAYYHLSQNLFYLLVVICVVVLLKKQVSGEWAFFISVLFVVPSYNRYAFVLPVMLLLSLPELVKRKNLWLKAWDLTSFLQGLYYPVYGAAVCMGFLPLGIWQVLSYARSGELKKDIRKLSFWLGWGFCTIPVIAGIPFLLGTLRHMTAMSGQTVYADGISRFGQVVPGNFFSYAQNLSTRLVLYYLFSFLIVPSVVWVSAATAMKVGEIRTENRKLKVGNPVPAGIALSVGIAMLVSISFTVIRLDIGNLYARSGGVVYAAFVMFLVVAVRYMGRDRRIMVYALFLLGAAASAGFFAMEGSSKLAASYRVSDGYVFVTDETDDRLGTCFVEQGMYDGLVKTHETTDLLDGERSYMGIVPNFGQFYLCGLRGGGTMEIYPTVKGYGAAQEAVDLIREQDIVVGAEMSAINNYYLYHWLAVSGEYVWSAEKRQFEPADGTVSPEEVSVRNKNIDIPLEWSGLGRTASSWGQSMDTLGIIFSDPGIAYTATDVENGVRISMAEAVDGDEADFLYLEFAGMDENYEYTLFDSNDFYVQDTEKEPFLKYLTKKDYNRGVTVNVSWTGEEGAVYGMSALMGRGKLLLPLGGGRGWLLNSHSDITVSVTGQDGQNIPVPEMVNLKFLKLREVE